MKGGKGRNEMHLNESTMINIMNKHIKYNSDQIVTAVRCLAGSSPMFIVVLDDKPSDIKKG